MNGVRYFDEWLASQPYAPCACCDKDTATCDLQRDGRGRLVCWECLEREEDDSE